MATNAPTTRIRPGWPLAFLALGILYLAGVVDAWHPTPDSALYQGLGRSLAEGRGYVFNGEGNTTVAPGLPAILGLIERLAGGAAYWAKNLLMSLCGLAGLWFAYASLRRWVGSTRALAAVAVTGLCSVYYLHSHLILTDAPFAMLFWAVVYCGLRMRAGSWLWLVPMPLLCMGAILIRLPGLTALGPLAVAFAVAGPRDSGIPSPLTGEGGPKGRVRVDLKGIALCAAILISIIAAAGGFFVAIQAMYDQPSQYVTFHFAEERGVLFRLGQLGLLLTKLPATVGEVFTGRQGWWVWLAGCPLLALVAAGLASQWRRGLRMPAVVMVLSILSMVLTAGIIAAKSRYYMPTLPLIALALLEGLDATDRWLARRRGNRPSPRSLVVPLALLAIAIVNAPFLARATIVEVSAAHRGQYHEAIAGGIYADLYPAARYLRENTEPNQTIRARTNRVRMLYMLTGRVIEPTYWFGLNDPWNAEQAETAYRDLLARPGVDWLVHDTGGLDVRYADRLTELLNSTGGLSLAWRSDRIRIYRRTGPLAPAAISKATAPDTTETRPQTGPQ